MTQSTSGGVVTAVLANCCANCVGKPAMQTHWMAGTAPYKSG